MDAYITALYKSDKITVGGMCYQTYPCQHDVNINGERKRMNGKEIIKLFKELGEPVPNHFSYLPEFHKKN